MSVGREAVEHLIVEAALSAGRTRKDVEAIIHKVIDENWIDSIEALRATQPDTFRAIGVPARLLDEIQRKLAAEGDTCSASQPIPSQPHSVESHQHSRESKPLSGSSSEVSTVAEADCQSPGVGSGSSMLAAVSYESPAGVLVDLEEVSTCCSGLQRECSDVSGQYERALRTLLKIVDGVLSNPESLKKRCLRKKNETFYASVCRYKNGCAFLKAIGFIEDETKFYLPVAYIARLTDAHQIIAALLKSMGLEVPAVPSTSNFNPYKAVISTSSADNAFYQPGPCREAYLAKIKEGLAAEARQTSNAEAAFQMPEGITVNIDENPRVYRRTNVYCPVARPSEEYNDSTSEQGFYLDPELMQKIRTNSLGRKTFKSRRKEQLKELMKRGSFTTSVIRVQFPDRLVLELTFPSTLTLRETYERVKKYLDPAIRNCSWFLYETPPQRVIPPSTQTLYDERLVPGALLYLKTEKGVAVKAGYLAHEWMKQLENA